MFLIFDTETTGLPKDFKAPVSDSDNWPRMVQVAWQLHDEQGRLLEIENFIIKPEGYTIPYSAEKIHGISTERAEKDGKDLSWVLERFNQALERTQFLAGHNVEFDVNIVGAEYYRKQIKSNFMDIRTLDTMKESVDFCAIPNAKGGRFKYPNLTELHQKLFNIGFDEAHNAAADVVATARCFLELVRLDVISVSLMKLPSDFLQKFRLANPGLIQPIRIEIESNKEASEALKQVADIVEASPANSVVNASIPFTHLHVHTQYSILDGAADIVKLIKKAKEDGMVAIAITDHGNMFGAKAFHNTAKKEGIKPILGCEVYIAPRSRHMKETKADGSGRHLVLLAKNLVGYHNLIKLVSYGWTEGYYYKPRIDKELLAEYAEGLIACSACLNGPVAYALRNEGLEKGLEELLEYKSIFGDDFYLELQRHKSGEPKIDKEVYEDQVFVNKHLIDLGQKTNTKVIATNDVHFINASDAGAHDRLLCISTGKDVDDENRMRYTRQEWMKTQAEMKSLFADVPFALENTYEIVQKIESYELNSAPIMPEFPIPEDFGTMEEWRKKFSNEDLLAEFGEKAYKGQESPEKVLRIKFETDYLEHITYQGALLRYGSDFESVAKERIDFEIETIKKMGFPGYFLIVWDFIRAAREMDVSVGPGRGSAAGSAVAYSLKITDIDPIKYDLLFERFLNPDRVSMPDIDIDFDEDGREKVLKWVVNKYGQKRVAHIVTFGTMAPKMAIRDVARVQKLELYEADRLAKLVPEKPGTNFKMAYKEVPELLHERNNGSELISSTLKYAEVLEGSVRQTGVHACGIIIGKNDLEEHVPISISKETELYVTQFDGKHVESVGMLKMDFLGLKTLSIIKDAIANVKKSKGIEIDIDSIPMDDKKTLELFSRGETTAIFQFESIGMKKHLRALKPNRFEDLIAMNALYRPGPMEYIPSFINRKHGREKIEYDLAEMEEYLKDTYGITVYQEQVMLLSQKLAGFTKGMADSLRKAMGKKIKAMMDELKEKFVGGCAKNGHDESKVQKIWKDWEAFAQYAFNKSHSTCYAWVSYQTAYLKAHFPAEFMSAVLSRNLNDIKKITFFMDECKRMGLNVKVPDVNESRANFTVNHQGDIRFGMAAIKGVGESAVDYIIEEREKNGAYLNIFDFVERVNLTSVNKRSIEGLILSGGFDSFEEIKRHQFFLKSDNNEIFLESLVKFGNKKQNDQNSAPTLFGNINNIEVTKPIIPEGEEWQPLEKLNKERELIGIYLSSHPLDDFRLELNTFVNCKLSDLDDMSALEGKEITVAGLITEVKHLMSKNGKPYGSFTIEDFTDTFQFKLFGKDYDEHRKYLYEGYSILIKGNVQQNTWKKENPELEFKIKKITLLSNAREEMLNSLSVKLPLDLISDQLIDEFKEQVSKSKGKAHLRFQIYDTAEGFSIELFSRNTLIDVNNELINYLDARPEFEYKVS